MMRKVLWVLGIAVLCLPMLFVSWLLLAARWAKMDNMTSQTPAALRQAIAGIILQKAGFGKQSLPGVERALRIDPEDGEAWERRCGVSLIDNGVPNLEACQAAVRYEKEPMDYYNLGRALEYQGNFCAAEDSYTEATSATSSHPDYSYLDSMGRAALRCGHLPASRAGLEFAIELEQKSLNDPNEDVDEIADTKKDMLADQEYLLIAYHRENEDTLAGQACTAAHPGWKACSCDLDAKGIVSCSEVKVAAKPLAATASTHSRSAHP